MDSCGFDISVLSIIVSVDVAADSGSLSSL